MSSEMCGLFGAASQRGLFPSHVKAIYELGLVSMTRGVDSSGCITLTEEENKDGVCEQKWYHVRDTKHFHDFWNMPVVQSLLPDRGRECYAYIGHNRWATIGNVNKDNAHPHRHKHIIGVHNGTIKDFQEKGSDSKHLFKLIAENGLEHALQKAKWGAYAIVWVDLTDHTINFIRNNQRDLFYQETYNGLIWASEVRFLEMSSGSTAPIKPFKTYVHYKYDVDENKMVEKDLEKSVGKWVGAIWSAKTSSKDSTPIDSTPTKTTTTTSVEDRGSVEDAEFENVVYPIFNHQAPKLDKANILVYGFRGFKGVFLPIKEARNLLAEGCLNCSKQSNLSQKVYWADHTSYICDRCVDTDATMEAYIPDMTIIGERFTSTVEYEKQGS